MANKIPFRIIRHIRWGRHEVIIMRNPEWNEYIVRFFPNGRADMAADYHTDSRADALDTACTWIAKERGTNP